ncbi:hypothetical protein [Roseimaritima ulvae]|uniref:Uncharacterized protein n=1 Tax=Roseimaritima ulvae TaxID=980254 RepID=A0A5B9QJP3_9BACT|nr:hypothetical protein [Roseimaritima ulvae]QEG38189.1 hypothetical protein UC8_01420 [Roseimaritima ulvae]
MTENVNDFLSDWLYDESLENTEPNSQYSDHAIVEESKEAIAESLIVHGLLADMGSCDLERETQNLRGVMERIDLEGDTNPVAFAPAGATGRRRFAILTSALTIATAVLIMFAVLGPQQNVSAAKASLEIVLEAAAKPFDRTYRVRVVEEYPRDRKPRNLSQEAWDREAKGHIDDATLFVRGVNQYVLTVMLRSGLKRTSGCDGRVSWAFREDGAVNVSTDLSRFRGGVPGQQQDIPFMNIHAHISQLRSGYEVKLTEERDIATDGEVLSQLVGVRKSRDVRGPKQIEIWFDADDGTVHRMLLDGLPRGQGGPKSVMLTLEDESDLAPNFFSHDAHHEPGKRVRYEEKKR